LATIRNYYKPKHYEFILRSNFSDRARLEYGRKMKTEKAEDKREAVSALPHLRSYSWKEE